MQASQFRDCQPCALHRGALDLVADLRGPGVAEQQRERPRGRIERGVVTRRDRTYEPRRHVRVELHLAFVKAQCNPGLAADRIRRRDFEDHRRGCVRVAVVLEGDAIHSLICPVPMRSARNARTGAFTCAVNHSVFSSSARMG